MKKETYRDIRKVNIKSSALLGIFLYIVLVLIFDMLLDLIDTTGGYPFIFGLIEMVVVIGAILCYSWLTFKNASQETTAGFFRYLIIQLIPLIVMTALTLILSAVGTSNTFTANWNATSWIVAPTLFFYLPFGFLFEIIKVIPFTMFMPLCIVLIGLLQYAGYAIGTSNRKYLREREAVLKEKLEANTKQQSIEAAAAAETIEVQRREITVKPAEAPATGAEQLAAERKPERRRYVLDDIEGEAVIKTEAMAKITDEMIEEALREKRIKSRDEKIAEARAKRMTENSRTISDEDAEKRRKDKELTQNLSKELEALRRRLNKREEDE